MKCNNCPAYCEETHYADGSPIGITETFCCIDFEEPKENCKRTLQEVKTILNERVGKNNNEKISLFITFGRLILEQ